MRRRRLLSEERQPVLEMRAARFRENVVRDAGVLDVPRQVLILLVALQGDGACIARGRDERAGIE